uniref:Succinate dehydrogenase subunit 5, mitochondrial n=2 Tax=Aegilops tauschii subsp. strangulata TaxID=200361 RepID=A0A453QJ53_AEGTS
HFLIFITSDHLRRLCSNGNGNNAFSWNSRRMFSSNEKHLPAISDPKIETAFKDLMAASWNELPGSLVEEAKKAVSMATDDKAGQEALENVFRAAEACEEFSGVLVTLRMALDDLCGLTGENVGPLPGYLEEAVKSAYSRYMTYLESFGPEEHYLRKKVESELGTKMIHLKMRCSGIGSEWGKVCFY